MSIEAREEILRELRKARDKQEASLANERRQSQYISSFVVAATSWVISLLGQPDDTDRQLGLLVNYLIALVLATLVLVSLRYLISSWIRSRFKSLKGFVHRLKSTWLTIVAVVWLASVTIWLIWQQRPNENVSRLVLYFVIFIALVAVGACWLFVHMVTGKRGEFREGLDSMELTRICGSRNDQHESMLDTLINLHRKRFEKNEKQLDHVRIATATQIMAAYIVIFIFSLLFLGGLMLE